MNGADKILMARFYNDPSPVMIMNIFLGVLLGILLAAYIAYAVVFMKTLRTNIWLAAICLVLSIFSWGLFSDAISSTISRPLPNFIWWQAVLGATLPVAFIATIILMMEREEKLEAAQVEFEEASA